MVFTCLWRCDLFFASAGKEFCRACHSSAGKRRWSIVTSPAVTGSCSCTCGWGFILSHFDDFWLETILSGWKGHSQTDLPLGVWYHWYLLLVTEDKMTGWQVFSLMIYGRPACDSFPCYSQGLSDSWTEFRRKFLYVEVSWALFKKLWLSCHSYPGSDDSPVAPH